MAGVNQEVKVYDLHQTVEIEAWFTIADERIDADGVVVKVKAPDGTVTTPTVTARVNEDGEPYYTAEVEGDQPGTWHYRAEATEGDDVGPFEHYFRVNRSAFS